MLKNLYNKTLYRAIAFVVFLGSLVAYFVHLSFDCFELIKVVDDDSYWVLAPLYARALSEEYYEAYDKIMSIF